MQQYFISEVFVTWIIKKRKQTILDLKSLDPRLKHTQKQKSYSLFMKLDPHNFCAKEKETKNLLRMNAWIFEMFQDDSFKNKFYLLKG